jgi:histidyl-tRNA synthetase
MMIADTMEELGIPRGSYVVKVNNRKVLDGVMEAIGLAARECGKRLTCCARSTSLIAWAGGVAAARPGRKDESGDFHKGRGLSAATT